MPNFGGTAPRWRHALGTASRKGIICFGPNRGRNSTFQKAPDTTTPSNHDPVNWLLTTYLHAYGPATAGSICPLDRRTQTKSARSVRASRS